MTNYRTIAHSEAQLNQLEKWITEYITINRDRLKQTGIKCGEVYTAYKASTVFPVGYKTFGPRLRQQGVDRLKQGAISYYVLFV